MTFWVLEFLFLSSFKTKWHMKIDTQTYYFGQKKTEKANETNHASKYWSSGLVSGHIHTIIKNLF